jgi:photosystem II stability/assembly factor-like uncharacterized protein
MKCLTILFIISFLLNGKSFSQNFWQPTNGPFGGTIYVIQSTRGDSILTGSNNGIFVSSDLGETWSSFIPKTRNKLVSDIVKYKDSYLLIIDYKILVKATATSFDTIYSASDAPRTVAVNSSGKIFLGTDFNIYSSTDLGSNWLSLKDTVMNINFSQDIIIKNDNIIFYSSGNYIYRSNNDGLTWVKINDLFSNGTINAIYLDAEGNLYAAATFDAVKLFRSSDNGNTWENIADSYGNPINCLISDSSNIYTGTTTGINKSTDGGTNWFSYSNGLNSIGVGCLTNCAGKITAGTEGGGIFFLNKDTNEWIPKSVGMNASKINDIVIDSENNVFAGTYGMGIQRELKDSSFEWETANYGLNDMDIYSLAVSKFEGSYDHIYCGTHSGAFKSTDKGQTWLNLYPPYNNDVYWVCINNKGGIFIWSFSGIFRTTDEGNSWGLMNLNRWGNVQCIASNPYQANVYVSDENKLYGTTDNGRSWINLYYSGSSAHRIRINSQRHIYILRKYGELLRSTDFGNSFQVINNGLPTRYSYLHDIAFDSEDNIYLATNDGMYKSKDNGASWSMVDGSNISKNINVLAFNNEDLLYAGTFNSGVYKSVEMLTNVDANTNLIKNFFLYQNYPNPFNPTTTISYSIPQSGFVELKIYDILGKEVAVLVDEEKSAGKYKVIFNGNNLSSGVYFYKLQTGSFMSAKKFVLMK